MKHSPRSGEVVADYRGPPEILGPFAEMFAGGKPRAPGGTGWIRREARATFDRYTIIDEQELAQAAAKRFNGERPEGRSP